MVLLSPCSVSLRVLPREWSESVICSCSPISGRFRLYFNLLINLENWKLLMQKMEHLAQLPSQHLSMVDKNPVRVGEELHIHIASSLHSQCFGLGKCYNIMFLFQEHKTHEIINMGETLCQASESGEMTVGSFDRCCIRGTLWGSIPLLKNPHSTEGRRMWGWRDIGRVISGVNRGLQIVSIIILKPVGILFTYDPCHQ